VECVWNLRKIIGKLSRNIGYIVGIVGIVECVWNLLNLQVAKFEGNLLDAIFGFDVSTFRLCESPPTLEFCFTLIQTGRLTVKKYWLHCWYCRNCGMCLELVEFASCKV